MDRETYFAFDDHPLRGGLSNEMHVRKLPPIEAPARLMQVVLMLADADLDAERAALRDLLGGAAGPGAATRYLHARIGDLLLIWERHGEFSSHMLISFGDFAAPFDPHCFAALPRDWFGRLPGTVLRATQVAVSPSERPDVVAEAFAAEDLVHCELLDRRAALWSDFRLGGDGFGRLLIVDRGMTPGEAALAVQRAQDLGNYRNLALLGLPVAQASAPQVAVLEQRLVQTSQEIAGDRIGDDALLRELSDLSAEAARIAASTQYRMSASRAYADLVEDRLRGLRIGRVAGHQSLDDFTEQRLRPAVRTCISFSSRLEALSQRLAWTSALLRTRVDTELSIQNRDLLRSMDRRTALQLRLQQTVEGLSVVAISYYAVGLLGHVIEGFDIGGLPHTTLLAILVPLVVIAACLGLRRVHRGLQAEGDPQ